MYFFLSQYNALSWLGFLSRKHKTNDPNKRHLVIISQPKFKNKRFNEIELYFLFLYIYGFVSTLIN